MKIISKSNFLGWHCSVTTVKPPPVVPASHMAGGLFPSCSTFNPGVTVLRTAGKDGLSVCSSATHKRDVQEAPGPSLAIVAIWGTNQHIEDLLNSPCIKLSFK